MEKSKSFQAYVCSTQADRTQVDLNLPLAGLMTLGSLGVGKASQRGGVFSGASRLLCQVGQSVRKPA